jgi:hypothetical protein
MTIFPTALYSGLVGSIAGYMSLLSVGTICKGDDHAFGSGVAEDIVHVELIHFSLNFKYLAISGCCRVSINTYDHVELVYDLNNISIDRHITG